MGVKTAYIGKNNYTEIQKYVESKEFATVSDAVVYCLRFFRDSSLIYGVNSLPLLNRSNPVKCNIRVPDKLVDDLVSLGFCKKCEVYDLAIEFYCNLKK